MKDKVYKPTYKNNSKYNLYVRKANLSILNSPALKKLNRIKYLIIQYDHESSSFNKGIVYKTFTSLTKIFMFDSFISYKELNGNKIKPFINLYIPTIVSDYIKFVYKDSILNDLDNVRIEDIDLLIGDIDELFRMQNKFYKDADYHALKEKYNLTSESSYKDKAKALHLYTTEHGQIPGFYFWLSIIYDVYPFVNYLGKATHTKNKNVEDSVFFIYPDRNDPNDRRG